MTFNLRLLVLCVLLFSAPARSAAAFPCGWLSFAVSLELGLADILRGYRLDSPLEVRQMLHRNLRILALADHAVERAFEGLIPERGYAYVEYFAYRHYAEQYEQNGMGLIVNEALMMGRSLELEEISYAAALLSFLNKSPVFQGTALRMVRIKRDVLPEFVAKYQVGQVFSWPAFSSAAVDHYWGADVEREPDGRAEVFFRIKSRHGRDVRRIFTTDLLKADELVNQEEIVFVPGSRFKVTATNNINIPISKTGMQKPALEISVEELD